MFDKVKGRSDDQGVAPLFFRMLLAAAAGEDILGGVVTVSWKPYAALLCEVTAKACATFMYRDNKSPLALI